MAAIPEPQHTLVRAIYGLHERREAAEAERPYLGGSEIGAACARRLWYRFRWAGREQFEGRMLRLFDTGHREEARVIDELRMLRMEVWDRDPQTGQQFEISNIAGHFRGHLDAVVSGLPEAPRTAHLVDVKTINVKKFAELLKLGIEKAFPKYYAQGQVYMGHYALERSAFVFVCKDTDEIHVARFAFNAKAFDALIEKARAIVLAPEPPPRLSEDPAWYQCKFCPFHAHCHDDAVPAPTCRSCAHATPRMDGNARWTCDLDPSSPRDLAVDEQRTGCPQHRFIPSTARWIEILQVDGNDLSCRNRLTGAEFLYGDAGYSSAELHAAAAKENIGDDSVDEIRAAFDGRVAG